MNLIGNPRHQEKGTVRTAVGSAILLFGCCVALVLSGCSSGGSTTQAQCWKVQDNAARIDCYNKLNADK